MEDSQGEKPLTFARVDGALASSPFSKIKKIWSLYESGKLAYDETRFTLVGQCVTVRSAKGGRLLFIELCDGSTVETLQCICDSEPADVNDPRRKMDWKPLMEHCTRGATLQLSGVIVPSPAPEQPIEFVAYDFVCLGKIDDPERYPLGQRGYLSRDFLRQIPDKRHHTQLFLALQILKQTTLQTIHETMAELGIGEIKPTLLTGNECEEGAHPFTTTILLDDDLPCKSDGSTDWSKDFFGKRVFLTVSSQLHLEATVLGTKRDGYCMTTVFRAEPSNTRSHAAEFLMPEWEIIGGGIQRNIAIAQIILQRCFQKVLQHCSKELQFLEEWHRQESIEEDPAYKAEITSLLELKDAGKIGKKKFGKDRLALQRRFRAAITAPSLVEKLTKWAQEPFVIVPHKECVRQIQEAIQKKQLDKTFYLDYGDDLSRQHEYWICSQLGGGLPVAVTGFPKKIKAFYMPVLDETNAPTFDAQGQLVEHVDCYDLLIPDVGEVVGGSQRIDDAHTLVTRMSELGMSLAELDWYIGLRRDASLPHGGAGLGFGRLMMAITGVYNIKDLQEFPRAYKLQCVA